MKYISTRGQAAPVSAEEAILRGLAPDGGLYVPEAVPVFSEAELDELKQLSYGETALLVIKKYLPAFSAEELSACIKEAYSTFDTEDPAPVVTLPKGLHVLELWHGPTCAFKDMALQLMPRILAKCREKVQWKDELHVLVATSGDTGKAALEGFKDVPGTKITVFYPRDGVSAVQKAQMVTQRGENVAVCAVNGNFDDAQTAVKEVFSDKTLAAALAERGIRFSSANSINWGRLLPQIVYYVRTACRLSDGGEVNFVVPTGNFGNILAGYYAKLMGAPIGRLLCASNANNVLTDFIHTGRYDRCRPFRKTISPSMDILVSSNLERLLYALSNGNADAVRGWMDELKAKGSYTVTNELLERLRIHFSAACCGEKETRAEIRKIFTDQQYLIDPHTAVAMYAAERMPLPGQTVVVSTASPFKFAGDVLSSIGDDVPVDGFEALDKLADISGRPVPASLASLRERPVRFTSSVDPKQIKSLFYPGE